jgi:hypothetical protein
VRAYKNISNMASLLFGEPTMSGLKMIYALSFTYGHEFLQSSGNLF